MSTSSQAPDVRSQLVGLLKLMASAELQREYERNVPHVDITRELVAMWFDDLFLENSGALRAGFSVTEWEDLLVRIVALLPMTSWLALGGSQPPGVPADALLQIGRLARDAGVKLLVDADGEPMKHGLEAGPHLIKPNSKEAARLLNRPVESEEETASAAAELRERLAAKASDPVVVIS